MYICKDSWSIECVRVCVTKCTLYTRSVYFVRRPAMHTCMHGFSADLCSCTRFLLVIINTKTPTIRPSQTLQGSQTNRPPSFRPFTWPNTINFHTVSIWKHAQYFDLGFDNWRVHFRSTCHICCVFLFVFCSVYVHVQRAQIDIEVSIVLVRSVNCI